MARIGLRMMLTSPWPPLKSRKASFPQYGFKAGISGGPACRLRVHRVVQFASALRAPRFLYRCTPVLSPGTRCADAPPSKRLMPFYPRGPRSSPGYSVPAHQHLIGPMVPHSQAQLDFTAERLIRAALAVRQPAAPKRPTNGSVLSLACCLNMSPSGTPGCSSVAFIQFL